MSSLHPDFPYFYPHEANALVEFQNQRLTSVHQLFWENRAKGNRLTLRLEVSFHFENGSALVLYADENRSGLVPGSFDREAERQKLESLNNPAVLLRVASEDEDADWEPFIGEILEAVELSAEAPGMYRNSEMILNFGFTKVMISRPEDGIEIEELVNEDDV